MKAMRLFRLVRKDGIVLADNLLPSEAYRLIKEGKAIDPFPAKKKAED
jgi:hypothetical protein